MPRKNIHPKVQEISYFMLDGTEVKIPSCYAKSSKMMLEIDIKNHVAWRDDKSYVNESLGNIAKFKQKFNISLDAISGVKNN